MRELNSLEGGGDVSDGVDAPLAARLYPFELFTSKSNAEMEP